MTITAETPVVNVGLRLSRTAFLAYLRLVGSPAAPDGGAGYDAVVAEGVDPAFCLAIFEHESNCATNPAAIVVRYQTKNPGNTRSSRTGAGHVTQTERGPFVVYDTWADGWRDLARRLVDPGYAYARAGATTPETIIPIWAPAGDGNDPDAYLDAVLAWMNAHADQADRGGAPMTATPTADDIGYPVRVHWAGDVGPKRDLDDLQWFVMHDTEGYPAGDEAILTESGSPVESAHALILPDGTLVFMVPLTVTAWTPGNDAVAYLSINVELSGFSATGYTDDQYRSAAAFFRWCRKQGAAIPAEYVGRDERPGIIAHSDVGDGAGGWGGSGHHTDPGPLFDWGKLVRYIGALPPRDTTRHDPVTGKAIIGGFRLFLEQLERKVGAGDALMLIGRPLTEELTEDGLTVQYFERAVFEWHPGALPAAFDVLLRRLGADALARRGGAQ